jgi:hypothetical protein
MRQAERVERNGHPDLRTPDEWAAQLAGGDPGGQTAALLETLDVDRLSPRGRIDALAVMERHLAWIAALQVHLLSRIEADTDSVLSPAGSVDEQVLRHWDFAAEEVACVLRISNDNAAERLATARQLAERYPTTLGLLERGEICYMQARNLVEGCRVLDPEVAARVEAVMVTKMPAQATGQSSSTLRRQIIKADPAGFQDRHQRRKKERQIIRYPQDDGMVTWGALVPAELGAQFDQAVDVHAATFPADDRTLSQRRVDALADLILNRPTTPATGAQGGRAAAVVQVTVPLDVLIGTSDSPAHLKGYGPIAAPQARGIAFTEGTIWRRLITEPTTGLLVKTDPTVYHPTAETQRHVIARDRNCMFPTCRMPANRCDLDHIKEFDHQHPEKGGTTEPANLIPLCRRHHLMKHRGHWRVVRDDNTGIATWTSPTGHAYPSPPHSYQE